MIVWETDLNKALARGAAEQKAILVDFYSPECIGCKRLDEVTFPERAVENFIYEKVVPLRLSASSKTLAAEFRVLWTPTLIVLDYYGKEHQRTLGFLPPDEMVATLLLGIGKVALGNDQFNEAVLQFNTLLNGYPQAACAPEAAYMRGVARFKSTHSPGTLKECYQQLLKEYPENEWTKRAEPFSLL